MKKPTKAELIKALQVLNDLIEQSEHDYKNGDLVIPKSDVKKYIQSFLI